MIFNFEKKTQSLAPLKIFRKRLLHGITFGVLLLSVTLILGVSGLMVYENMPFVDAFANASMIMSGVGAITPIVSYAGKIFSGIYSLVSGFLFVCIIGVIFSPVIHRLFHKFHLGVDK